MSSEVQRWAQQRATELPGSQLEHPFGPDFDVFKVRGRVFLILTQLPDTDEYVAVLKARPEDSESLRQEYVGVTPGYHMNKRHWITLHPGRDLDHQHVAELVTESYRLVVDKLPKKARPVDPGTFGLMGT